MNLGMCTARVNSNVGHVFTNLPPHFPRKTKHSVWARIRRVSDPVIISSSYDISPIIHYLLFQPVDHWENKNRTDTCLCNRQFSYSRAALKSACIGARERLMRAFSHNSTNRHKTAAELPENNVGSDVPFAQN